MKNAPNFVFLLLTAFLFHYSALSQIKVASGNFEYTNVSPTILPERPTLCSNMGSGVELTCVEDFISYKWELINSLNQVVGTEYGKSIFIHQGGRWRLTVQQIINTPNCDIQKDVFVYDLQNEEHIKKYFEEEGFYCIPIFRNEVSLHEEEETRNETCIYTPFSFTQEGPYQNFVENAIENFVTNFPPIKDENANKIVSQNNCLCTASNNLENYIQSFNAEDFGLWTHIFFGSNNSNGCLFLKGKLPRDPSLPNANQISHFETTYLLDRIYQANSSNEDRLYALAANVFFPHPIGGYFNENLCNKVLEESQTYLTNAGIAVKIDGTITGYFAPNENEEGLKKGTLVWLSKETNNQSNLRYQGFKYKDNRFSGYGNEETGDIYNDFLDPNSTSKEVPYFYANCETECSAAGIIQNDIKFRPDGGLNIGMGNQNVAESSNASLFYVPSALRNDKTICFVTPTKSIIAFPNEGFICSKLQYFELTYGSFIPNTASFLKTATSGMLYKFIYENELYVYNFDSKSYESDIKVYNGISPEPSDGVVYALAVPNYSGNGMSRYGFYRLNRGNLPNHVNGVGLDYFSNFLDFTSTFTPFGEGYEKTGGPVFEESSSNCLYCPSDITSFILNNNTEKPWHIYIDKLAQIATVFRNYFGTPDAYPTYQAFTIYDPSFLSTNDWNLPISYKDIKFKWEEFLVSNPNYKNYYLNGTDEEKTKFYRKYLEQFLLFIKNQEDNFWNNIQHKTAEVIVNHLKNEPQFVANSKDFNTQKKVGLKTLLEKGNYSELYQNAIIHLLAASNNENDADNARDFIEQTNYGGFNGVNFYYTKFTNWDNRNDNLTRVITIISSIASKGNTKYLSGLIEYLDDKSTSPKVFPKLESDMLKWDNLDFEIYNNNTIKIEGIEDAVPYNAIIPVEFVGTVVFGNQTYPAGTITHMPAIQAALFSHSNGITVAENTAWVAIDVGALILGVGAAKKLWTGAHWIKKAFIVADIAGTSTAISAQLLNSSILNQQQKRNIQVAAFVSSGPLLISEIPRIAKILDNLAATRNANATHATAAAIQNSEEEIVKGIIYKNNAEAPNGIGPIGPYLDDPIEDAKTLVAIDDPIVGIEGRLANEVLAGAGYACLTGDTPISTQNGFTLLKDIKDNDEVITTGNKPTKVISKIKNVVKSLVILTLCNGEEIKASPDHIFYTDKHEYLVSQDIVEGSRLLNKNGETIEVCNVAKKDTITGVYDLLTQDGEYSAGESGVMSGTCILRFLAENKTVYPNLYNNYKAFDKSQRAILVQNLYEARKNSVLDYFANFLNEQSGFNAYKAYSTYKVDVLNAVKNMQLQGKLYNGVFNIRLNPGCIGHFDDDVKIVLLDEGWELVEEGSTYYSFEKIIGIYPSGTPKKAYFNYNVGTSGGEHGPNVSYWKLNELTPTNQGVIYRSTNDPNFQYNPNISGSIYLKGVKIK